MSTIDDNFRWAPDTPSPIPLPLEGFVRIKRALPPLGPLPFGRTTLYKKIKEGTFPALVRLGPRTVAIDVAQLRQYLAAPQKWEA